MITRLPAIIMERYLHWSPTLNSRKVLLASRAKVNDRNLTVVDSKYGIEKSSNDGVL